MKCFRIVILWLLAAALCACSDAKPREETAVGQVYEIPPFRNAVFNEEAAQAGEGLLFDSSHSAEGYVGVKITENESLKFQVESGDQKYNYDVAPGETAFFPMNLGSGSYTFRLLKNAGDNRFAVIWKTQENVALENEFVPYRMPCQLVNYSEDSQCVELARELAAGCATQSQVVSAIYDYLVRHISYDDDRAQNVTADYLPNPDRTLSEKKGICYDYASLAAAMMRSVGIPCKLIMGYVDGSLYHAWNSFYLDSQGWVTVEIKANAGVWQRVDITMAASGEKPAKLEDDSRYTTRYSY